MQPKPPLISHPNAKRLIMAGLIGLSLGVISWLVAFFSMYGDLNGSPGSEQAFNLQQNIRMVSAVVVYVSIAAIVTGEYSRRKLGTNTAKPSKGVTAARVNTKPNEPTDEAS